MLDGNGLNKGKSYLILKQDHRWKNTKTRTTNVVRNAGCARSRYTQNFFNQSINESMNQ